MAVQALQQKLQLSCIGASDCQSQSFSLPALKRLFQRREASNKSIDAPMKNRNVAIHKFNTNASKIYTEKSQGQKEEKQRRKK